MKILAPVNSAGEVPALISHGAMELYCGVHPGAWTRRHGKKVWLNRRGAGNVESFAELKEITGIAHSRGVTVCLTLNLPFYPPEHYGDVLAMAERATAECGVDALIVADPGLIRAIKESAPNTVIPASSLAVVLNSQAVRFFRKLGAARIIFPRYTGLANLRQVIAAAGEAVEYEVFILNDGCMFEEGYCHASHSFGGAFCSPFRDHRLVPTGGKAANHESFESHLADYRRWICRLQLRRLPRPRRIPQRCVRDLRSCGTAGPGHMFVEDRRPGSSPGQENRQRKTGQAGSGPGGIGSGPRGSQDRGPVHPGRAQVV